MDAQKAHAILDELISGKPPQNAAREPQNPGSLEDIFGPVIYSYSRQQAIEDGYLVEIPPDLCREAGIAFPVAMTRTVWEAYVEIPEGVKGQDESGRLWDILWMLKCAIRAAAGSTDRIDFGVHVRNNNRERTPPLRRLKAMCGPGDEGEPVITIMLPEED